MAENNNNNQCKHPDTEYEVFDQSLEDFESHQTSVKTVQAHVYDNDQTFLKTVQLTPLGPPSHLLTKGENHCSNKYDISNHSYPDNSFVDPDSYPQCGQNISDEPYTACKLDSIVYDRIDNDLYNLPKEIYISSILKMTDNCEETLSHYRHELAARPRQCENPPVGVLKDRRKSMKYSVADKYAQDCYTLNQFLSGNIMEVDDLFKKANNLTNISVSQTPRVNTDFAHDINLLKNNVSSLQSEVHILKIDAADTKSKLSSFSSELKAEIALLKNELSSCSFVLAETAKCVPQCETNTLSGGLKAIALLLNKLDNSRSKFLDSLSEVTQTSQDNSVQLQNMHDLESKQKNALKVHLNEVNDKLDNHVQNVVKSSASSHHENQIKLMDHKIKQIDKKVSQNDTNSCFNNAFESFSKDLVDRFDMLNSSLKESIASLVTSNRVNNNPNVAPHTKQKRNVSQPSVQTISAPESPESYKAEAEVPSRPDISTDTHIDNVENRPKAYTSDDNTNHQEHKQSINSNVIDLTGVTSHQQEAEIEINVPFRRPHAFKGVIRKKAKSYIIVGIDLDSDQDGLEEFLTDTGITYKSAKFLSTRRTDSQVAQIVIHEDQAPLVEDPETWPPGISCRPWLKRPDYRERYANID